MNKITIALAGVLLLSMSAQCFSQQSNLPSPRSIQQLEQEQLAREEEERRLQRSPLVIPEIIVPQQHPDLTNISDEKNIPVEQFVVDKSEYLETDEVIHVLSRYLGRNVSLKDLLEATSAINELYKSKNISTARAILPPQEIKEGRVRVQFIEARLGEVKVTGISDLHSDFVSDRISLQSGELISVEQIEKDLVRYNSLYDTKLRANIGAGSEIGKSDLWIQVLEARTAKLSYFLDNSGGDSVGRERLGGIYRVNNLFELNDNLQILLVGSEGSESVGLSYSRPVGKEGKRLDISYNHGDIELVNGEFVPLNITGSSQSVSLGVSHPFLVDINQQWDLYGRISSRKSISRFSGLVQQKQNLTVESLGIKSEVRSDSYAWSMDSSINFALDSLSSDEQFVYFRSNATRIDHLSGRHQLITRGSFQYGFGSSLPSGEQFQLGGSSTVRGYSEGLLSARHGYAASAEFRTSISSDPAREPSLFAPRAQIIMFFETGGVFVRNSQLSREKYLSSLGTGMQFDHGTNTSSSVTLAIPLREVDENLNQDDWEIRFSLNFSWF